MRIIDDIILIAVLLWNHKLNNSYGCVQQILYYIVYQIYGASVCLCEFDAYEPTIISIIKLRYYIFFEYNGTLIVMSLNIVID